MNNIAEKTDTLIIKTGDSLDKTVNTLEINYENPIKAIFNNTPVLIREIDDDQVELLFRRKNGLPVMGYLILDDYRVLSKRIKVPDDSYVYEKGSVYDKQLKDSGI